MAESWLHPSTFTNAYPRQMSMVSSTPDSMPLTHRGDKKPQPDGGRSLTATFPYCSTDIRTVALGIESMIRTSQRLSETTSMVGVTSSNMSALVRPIQGPGNRVRRRENSQ